MARRSRSSREVLFSGKLALHSYMLGLFGVETFRRLGDHLKDPSHEGRAEDGVSRFHHTLAALLPADGTLTADRLLTHDENIHRHTESINRKRTRPIEWKYFQYLSLLFTEIYLDAYFRDANALREALNEHLAAFNDKLAKMGARDAITPHDDSSLRKVAFWNATGSGKTLIMHMNIHQYLHYLGKSGRTGDLNRIVLLTPREGLSHQHLEEFKDSGMPAAAFDKDSSTGGFLSGKIIDVIDMHKLKEEGKRKTVSADAFETNNLVLVDEGHRGARGELWYDLRQKLSRDGFAFEYSATLGQAVGQDKKLTDEYAKTILFDYSYRHFHADGHGKDFTILNIDDDQADGAGEKRRLYLTACLLAYYQQLRLFEERGRDFHAFLPEKPLWVFVGGTVNAVRAERKKPVSDVLDILLFLAGFVKDKPRSMDYLETLTSGETGLLDSRDRDIFSQAFPYLIRGGETPGTLFDDILARLFNAPAEGMLHVEELKGGEGEIALKIGDNEEFGLISIGDPGRLTGLCKSHEDHLAVVERSFSGALFKSIDKADSTIKLLIGSKKFSEGWNSWRVSTLGLMHMGKKEGPEIIQLFGRGVRLKGYEGRLKRSRAIHWATRGEDMNWVLKDHDLPILETLNVFGVQSSYMAQFRQYLEDEGVPGPDDLRAFDIPVTVKLPGTPLLTIRMPEGIDFKKERKTTLGPPPDGFLPGKRVVLDWYPRIEAESSQGIARHTVAPNEEKLDARHMAFLDMWEIFLELERLKNERRWYNFNLGVDAIRELLLRPDWYVLQIPRERMRIGGYERVREWREIAIALLRKYCDRYYKFEKDAFETPHREYGELDINDPNFFDGYRVLIDRSQTAIIERLERLQQEISEGALRDFRLGGIGESIVFDRHLYKPLLYLTKGADSDMIRVTPTCLNEGEYEFVRDLRSHHDAHRDDLRGKEIYLLRNLSRGVGFFEAGNFHPDFILWIVEGGRQSVNFIDPKGIRNLDGLDDPKIEFRNTIKEIEGRMRAQGSELADKITLNSFIISNTALEQVSWWKENKTLEDFAACHVFFQEEDKAGYMEKIFNRIG